MIFVVLVIGLAISINNVLLAIAGVLIGLLFMWMVKSRVKGVMVDERIENISGQAARATYSIVTMSLALSSLIFIVVSKTPDGYFLQTLGVIFSYITMFSVAVYSIAYWLIGRNYE